MKEASLFLGNAGTAFRSLAAVLALGDGHYRLEGVSRMHERPIGDLVDALRQAGARIDYLAKEGFPPLSIAPRQRGATDAVRVRGEVSSQFLTALLIALGACGGGVRLEVVGELVSRPYVEMTLALMRRFGVSVVREGWSAFAIPAGARYVSPGHIDVEGDASSASYFLAAGLLGGGPVRVEGLGLASLQGDVRFTEVIEAMGGKVAAGSDWIEVCGHPPLKPLDADLNAIPDAAMTAAVLALFAAGPSRLRNIASWRVKETDRLAAMANRTSQARRIGAGGRGLPGHHAAARVRRRFAAQGPRGHRHLRRPPDGDELRACLLRSGPDSHQRSGVRVEDFSGFLRFVVARGDLIASTEMRRGHSMAHDNPSCPVD